MLNIFLTTVMAVISVLALAVCMWCKNYAFKSKFTIVALIALSALSIVQAITATVSRVSIAWWLLLVIFIVLLISTCMSYSERKKHGIMLAEEFRDVLERREKEAESIEIGEEEIEVVDGETTPVEETKK